MKSSTSFLPTFIQFLLELENCNFITSTVPFTGILETWLAAKVDVLDASKVRILALWTSRQSDPPNQ